MNNAILLDFGTYQVDPDKLLYCKGLDAADFIIDTSPNGQGDGSTVDNKRIGNRYVDFAFTIHENERERIIRFFNVKSSGQVTATRNNVSRVLNYTVQKFSAPPDDFTGDVTVTVALLCADPFLYDVSKRRRKLDSSVGLIGFPRCIRGGVVHTSFEQTSGMSIVTNSGNEKVGFIAEFVASGDVVNPKIQNFNNAFVEVKTTMRAGDALTISTLKGKKSVKLNGEGIMHKINKQSTFFPLDIGFNEMKYDAQSGRGELKATLYFTPIYWGL